MARLNIVVDVESIELEYSMETATCPRWRVEGDGEDRGHRSRTRSSVRLGMGGKDS